jgi:hypothetical protein
LKGVLEVADIIDELKMIRHLLRTQRDVLKSTVRALTRLSPSKSPRAKQHKDVYIHSNTFTDDARVTMNINTQGDINSSVDSIAALAQDIAGIAKDNVISADEILVAVLAGLDDINKEAEYTHRMVKVDITLPYSGVANIVCSYLISWI